jgi:hypothetical protein
MEKVQKYFSDVLSALLPRNFMLHVNPYTRESDSKSLYQSTQKEGWRRCYSEEEGEPGLQGHRDVGRWVVWKLNRGLAEVRMLHEFI